MSDEAKVDYAWELRRIASSLVLEGCEIHECTEPRILCEAADSIERLAAEVERLTPKHLTTEQIVDIFNKKTHQAHGGWRITMGDGSFNWIRDKPGYVLYSPFVSDAIAQAYLRDGGKGGAE